jgi:hypothetical protein
MIFWLVLKLEIYKGTKNPIKPDGQNHHTKEKKKGRGEAKETRPKDVQPQRTKERRGLIILLVVGNYLTHSLPTCKL